MILKIIKPLFEYSMVYWYVHFDYVVVWEFPGLFIDITIMLIIVTNDKH